MFSAYCIYFECCIKIDMQIIQNIQNTKILLKKTYTEIQKTQKIQMQKCKIQNNAKYTKYTKYSKYTKYTNKICKIYKNVHVCKIYRNI